jgi:hypothetical protein
LFASCTDDKTEVINDTPRLLKGPEVVVSNGKAWTYIGTSPDNKPLKVGIHLTTAAIPETAHARVGHDGHESEPGAVIHTLQLPENKTTTVFDHVTLDWNPNGHAPENVYTKPHFDFHFYMSSQADLDKIPSFEVDSTGHKHYPQPGYLPANYVPIPGGVPKMGVHWADITSPELNPAKPEPFTQTFIYGSYNGKVNFYEPMVTADFLKSITTKFERNVPLPEKFSKAGYYPTKMSITKTTDGCAVELSGFVYKPQS